jgi:hypothetical protein
MLNMNLLHLVLVQVNLHLVLVQVELVLAVVEEVVVEVVQVLFYI